MTREDMYHLYSETGKAIRHALWKYDEANSKLWVTSLCYYTVLSLVPIFAILFSIGTWMGLGEYLIKQIDAHSPLKGEAITIILSFADNLLSNARGGLLAGLGFIFLMWTLISMFSIIEKAFNDIWDVDVTRSFIRKISDYLTFFILLPILILLSNATSLLLHAEYMGGILPYFSVLLFFTALFMVMPNTEVRFIPAFIAGFCTSVMFSIFQYSFIYLQVWINTYNKIYGSFSVIFIFLIWLRIAWFLIILGAHLSYLLQNKNIGIQEIGPKAERLSFHTKFSLSLKIVRVLVQRYVDSEGLVSREEFIELFHNGIAVDSVLRILKKSHILVESQNAEQEKFYSLAKNIDKVRVLEIYQAVANYGENLNLGTETNFSRELLDLTLRDLGGNQETNEG